MNRERILRASDRWFRLLTRLYPTDFRDEMGSAMADTYRDRARRALDSGSTMRLAAVWGRALSDSLRNGLGERLRPSVAWRRMGNWGRDMELATRRLIRAPLFTLATVGTLTLGLGAFAVVYTAVQKILVEPMPYAHSDDLYFVWRDYGPIFDLNRGWLGGTDIVELGKTGDPIEAAVGTRVVRSTFTVDNGMDPAEIAVLATTPNVFDVLGVHPASGRGFAPNEGGPGRPPVVVLTHALWNRLGANSSLVGATVRLNGEPYTVIGIMPRSFTFVQHRSLGPPEPVEAYTTFDLDLAETNPNAGSYAGLIRARRGASPEVVAAAVDAVGRRVDERDFQSRGLKLYPVQLKGDLVAHVRPALIVLGVAGAFLVLVLMLNLASLLLTRAVQREQEYAVSRALGANGMALVRAMVFEGGWLGLIGGAAGALAAMWGTRALVALAPLDLPRRDAIDVDWRVGMTVLAIGGLLGVLAAIAPAIWAARTSLSSLLSSSAVRGGGGQGRMRRSMVVVQVALSLVLLTTGGLVVRSFERMLVADPGFNSNGVLTVRVPMPAQLVPEPAEVLALQDRVHDALEAIPGVASVGAASSPPLTAGASQGTVTIPGAPGLTGDGARDAPLVDRIMARAGYIETMGIRLVAGRTFEPARREGVREVLIDSLLARQFFPTGDPLGATIPIGDDNVLTVVGVVDQARLYDVHRDGRPQMFVRAEDNAATSSSARNLTFVLRTSRDPASLIPEVRSVIRHVDPQLAIADVRPMDEIVDDALRQQRMSAVLIVGFALGALLLAAMGLFGVVSGSVTRRRHELAVRMALGAEHGRLLRLVLREGALLVGVGVLVGVPGIYLASGFVRSILVGVSPSDPVTLVSVAIGLALVALTACYLPARRVLRIQPAQSLRQD